MEPLENQPAAMPPEPETPVAGGETPPQQPDTGAARPSGHEALWETVRSLLIVVAGVLFMRSFIAEATVIPTGSMEDTILIGDHVFLNKLLYGPRIPYTNWRFPEIRKVHRQDIVAFRYPVNPSMMFVKRVIGVGGDVVRVVNQKVYVNGKLLNEPYAHFEPYRTTPLAANFPPPLSEIPSLPAYWGLDPTWARQMPNFIRPDGLHVPQGYLFCMGDNRDNSLDSRYWGFVPLQNVVGEPLFVYWSYDAPSKEWTSEDLKDRLKFDGSIVWNFISRTRWSRTGKIF